MEMSENIDKLAPALLAAQMEMGNAVKDAKNPFFKSKYADLIPDKEKHGNGPAVYYKSEALQGSLGFISANTHRFCAQCNRLRLTSTGFLKPCLCYDMGVDLRTIVRTEKNQVEEKLAEAFQQAIALKPEGHCFAHKEKITEHKAMNQIGG